MKQNEKVFRRRCLTAVCAVASAAAVFGICAAAETTPFVEYDGWAEMQDVVAIARFAAGDPVLDYEFAPYIRYDVNCDGVVSQDDADILADYIQMYDLFDAVLDIDGYKETQDLYRMEISERYNVPIQYVMVFYGFRPDQVVQYYADHAMIDRVFTIADGGRTGYAIQEEPWFGDITYDAVYETGDIVAVFNVFLEGNPHEIVEQTEVRIGNVSDLGFEYEPRQEVVERVLRNLE